MINKIMLHNGGKKLGLHLQKTENEHVRVVEAQGGLSEDIDDAIDLIMALAAARSRHGTKRPFAHFAFSPDVALREDQTRQCVRDFLVEYDLPPDQPCLLVGHVKHREDGSAVEHFHLVALTVKPDGRVADFTNRYQRNEALARKWEIDFGHDLTLGRHTRAAAQILTERGFMETAQVLAPLVDHARPVAAYTQAQAQSAKRRGRSKTELTDTLADMAAAWRQSDDGASFQAALAERGMTLAMGTRAVLVVDREGQDHPLLRLLKGQGLDLRKKDIDRRLKDLFLPDFAGMKLGRRLAAEEREQAARLAAEQRRRNAAQLQWDWRHALQEDRQRTAAKQRQIDLAEAARRREVERQRQWNTAAAAEQRPGIRHPEKPRWQQERERILAEAYSTDLAERMGRWYRIERGAGFLTLRNQVVTVTDYGDRITARQGNDQEITAMLQLARAKGWKMLAFTGSTVFQQRAAEAAMAAGFTLADAALERDVRTALEERERAARIEEERRQVQGREIRIPEEVVRVLRRGRLYRRIGSFRAMVTPRWTPCMNETLLKSWGIWDTAMPCTICQMRRQNG